MSSITLRYSFTLFTSAFACYFFFVSVTFAQDNIPSIESFQSQENQTSLPIPDRSLGRGFGESNPYFHETLTLHHQIGLLEQMIRRQSYIARLEKNYIELGLPFVEPAPPRGICEQIPANIPCARSYPDIYDISLPVVSDFDAIPLSIDMLKQDLEKKKETFLSDQYRRSDIACDGDICEATIIDIMDPSKPLYLKEGDQFANDQLRVVKVSFNGVFIEERGQTRKIEILQEAMRDVIRSMPSSVFENESEEERPELDNDTFQDTVNFPEMPYQQPALGSTGLF